jgi:phosphate transport system substrate-binding protein
LTPSRMRLGLSAVATIGVLLAACSSPGSASPTGSAGSANASGSASASMDLGQVPPAPSYDQPITASGATFPQPVYEQWTQDYANETGIQISYTGGGSGQGIADITDNVVAFAGSDAPMKDEERQAAADAQGTQIIHIPTVFGAVVMAYNLAGVDKVNFSPDVIGKIFTGEITNWNDPAIAADNSGTNLPDQAITVVHRNDGSGTTNGFTTWLCSVSDAWKAKLGEDKCKGKEIEWPVGLGGQGNPGVASTITTTPGAVGYVELAYAVQNGISYGNVENAAGTFVEPTLESVAAAANFDTIPDDLTFNASGSDVADAYPITAATWLLVYAEQDKVAQDEGQAQAVVHFLLWALDKGGAAAEGLDYAVLPDKLREAALAKIATITWNGTPVVDSLYGQ